MDKEGKVGILKKIIDSNFLRMKEFPSDYPKESIRNPELYFMEPWPKTSCYPVISISLKDVGGEDFQSAYEMLCTVVSEEASLKLLIRLLRKHYGTSVIVLIDEYDVPLDKAYQNGYYSRMVNLIRSIFGQVLKTNENLEFAVVAGCLQIAE